MCILWHPSWISVPGSMIDGSVRPQRSEPELPVSACVCVCLAGSDPLLPQDRRVADGPAVCVCASEVAEVRVLLSLEARLFPVPTTRLTQTRCVFTQMYYCLCEFPGPHAHTRFDLF